MADGVVLTIETEVVYAGPEGVCIRVRIEGYQDSTYISLTPEDLEEYTRG